MEAPQRHIRLTFSISLENHADVAVPRITERNPNLKTGVQ